MVDPALIDPMAALPGAAEPLSKLSPYQFRKRGVAWLLEQPEPSDPVGRLVLARALLDALLYGELAQDGALLDALTAADHWARLERLLEPQADVAQGTKAIMADGAQLCAALRQRPMDAQYHRFLARLAQPKGFWRAEAMIAGLLDLDEVALDVFAGRLCPDGPLESCVWSCPEAPEGASGAVIVAACGHDVLGWPVDANDGAVSAQMVWMARLMGPQVARARALLRLSHPLVLAAEPELEALVRRVSSAPLALPLPPVADGALAAQWSLALASGQAQPFEGQPLYAGINAEGLWLGLVPMIASGDGGRAQFLEARAGFGFPGWWVVHTESLSEGSASQEAHVASVASKGWALAEDWAPADVDKGGPRRGWSGLPVLVSSDAPMAAVLDGLDLLRRSLGGGQLDVRLVVWSPQREAFVWRALRLLPGGAEGQEVLDAFPSQVRPLDLRVQMVGQRWRLEARGEEVAGGQGQGVKGLSEAAADLWAGGGQAGGGEVTLRFSQPQGTGADLVSLLEALGAVGGRPGVGFSVQMLEFGR